MSRHLVVAYGSLLNSDEREKEGIVITDRGIKKLEGYRFSFDYRSRTRGVGVLNLRHTGNNSDHVYVKVYEMDGTSYAKVQDRELGEHRISGYAETWIETEFGKASLFVIVDDKISLTPTDDSYVDILKKGYAENFSGDLLKHNLAMLEKAVAECNSATSPH